MLMQGLGQLFQSGDSAQLLEAFIPDGRKGLAVIAGRITQKVVDALIIRFQDLLDIISSKNRKWPIFPLRAKKSFLRVTGRKNFFSALNRNLKRYVFGSLNKKGHTFGVPFA